MVDSLNIVRGMLMEAVESLGTLSLELVAMLSLLNGDLRDFNWAAPENDRPEKFCDGTDCKLMA